MVDRAGEHLDLVAELRRSAGQPFDLQRRSAGEVGWVVGGDVGDDAWAWPTLDGPVPTLLPVAR